MIFVFAFAYSREFSRNVQRLILNARRFAQGLEYEKIYLYKPLELQHLATAMNKMFDQLQDRISTVRRQKHQLEAILEGMVEAVLVLDKKGKVITWNSAAGRLFPTERSPLGLSLLEITRNTELDALAQTLLQGGVKETRVNILLRDFQTTLQVQGAGLYWETGELWGTVLVMSDVTQLVKLEAMRRDFVANVSHELKTPITNILGFVETLENGALDHPEKARQFLNIISRHAERLNLIVDDLLILSKIENRPAQEWEKENTVLQDLLTAAASVCQKKLQKKDIRLKYDVPEEPLLVAVHPLLLEQAVVNLLDNAIKFSGDKTTITLSLEQSNEGVLLAVTDQGPGIPEHEKDRIFERFYRTEKGREKEGTGLGLSIVRHIMLLHRGRVAVDSPVPGRNKGTRFTLTFPKSLVSYSFEQED
ncbi:MAG: PAS domain-containing protein [Spirochaetales bacterium]|nr:PAS domain-containing protein [Spirochaetales bacterium]